MGFRVWAGVGALFALVALTVVIGVALILGMRAHEQRLNGRSVPFATSVVDASLAAKGVANDERGFLMSGDDTFIVEAARRIAVARSALSRSRFAASNAGEQRALDDARAGFERWIAAILHEFATYRRGDRRAAVAASLGSDRALRKRYEAALSRAEALGEHDLQAGEASVAAASSRSVTILVGCLIVSLIAGLSVAYWLVRSIAVPVAGLLSALAGAEEVMSIRS